MEVIRIRLENGKHSATLTLADTIDNRLLLLAMQRGDITWHRFNKLVGRLERVKVTHFCIERPMEGHHA